jgi:phage tail sheath protein FI
MTIVINDALFNPSALTTPDVYEVVIPPQAYVPGAPASVSGLVGTASWGPLNLTQLIGNTNDLNQAFGTISAAALTDIHDLATDVVMALNQGSQAGLTLQCIRVSDGTDEQATLILVDTNESPATGGTLTALYSGVLGNQIQITISAGAADTLVNVILAGWGGKPSEYYPALPNTSAFWAALASALANGTGPTQGPSQLCRLTVASSTHAPALITGSSLTGGTDGRTVTTADLVGDSAADPPTGMYALLSAIPTVQQLWIVGLSDTTAFPALVNIGEQNGILTMATVPVNTSVADAITAKNTVGANSFEFALVLDWCIIFDPINNVQRTITPMGVAGGLISALSPEQSPLNQEVYGILGTPRINQATGVGPYSSATIGLANTNGIILLTNPIPLGAVFGFRTGVNTSPEAVTTPIEYSRMTNFILQSVAGTLGQFIGQLQSQSPTDKLRANVKAVLDNFFNELENNDQLDAHNTTCDLSNNTPTTIAQHILRVDVQARYLASVWYLIFTLQGGTTVQISAAVITPGQP